MALETFVMSPGAARAEIAGLIENAVTLGTPDAWFTRMSDGARCLLAYQAFNRIVREGTAEILAGHNSEN